MLLNWAFINCFSDERETINLIRVEHVNLFIYLNKLCGYYFYDFGELLQQFLFEL